MTTLAQITGQTMVSDLASTVSGINDELSRDAAFHQLGMEDAPQWMRRCFMTGKQCIFCPHETVFETGESGRVRDSVFVIMPFTANLETFYEWSLRPYLQSFGFHADNIRRADQFANTGYVMCEKICLRIQQAYFVVVDISLFNPNVFYELGMAVGLNKPLLVVCDGSRKSAVEKYCEATGLKVERVLYYPNVGHIDAKSTPLAKRIQRVPLKPRTTTMEIRGVLLEKQGDASQPPPSSYNRHEAPVTFGNLLEAAVGVAMQMLKDKHPAHANGEDRTALVSNDQAAQLAAVLRNLENSQPDGLPGCRKTTILDDRGVPQKFRDVADHLDSALIAIMDLVSQNPLSYFWLGYCHARNINCIPIYRDEEPSAGAVVPQTAIVAVADGQEATRVKRRGQRKRPKDNVLAFDIRALWYMWHQPDESRALAGKLAAVFEPILLRDVATQQRRIFWERLTRSGKVFIYNGAVHHQSLNREVVGDWDLRTASELISYLSSTDESVVPDLKSPLYSPETVAEKLRVEADEAFLKAYEERVRHQLKGKNCVIVASADVNPLTEVILGQLHRREGQESASAFIHSNPKVERSLVVAVKGEAAPLNGAMEPVRQSSGAQPLPRRFYCVANDTSERGFYIDGQLRTRPYQTQNLGTDPFEIYAHLVVARNPFSDENVVVILNGVSGPATYGLAQLLTGAGGTKAAASEALLQAINERWAQRVEREKKKGVEAIVSVMVSPAETSAPDSSDTHAALSSKIERNLFDTRTVDQWRFVDEQNDGFRVDVGNPREIPFN